eukprot:15361555-Ditylum_brightwellii.AAC.1
MASLAVQPTADSYVRGGTYAAKNYGSSSHLQIKKSPSNLTYDQKAFLTFDLPGFVAGSFPVTLRLYVSSVWVSWPQAITISRLRSDATWVESGTNGITYSTFDSSLIDMKGNTFTITKDNQYSWIEAD